MVSYCLLFVSVLDESVASHRFRVIKLAPLLQSSGISISILRFNARLEIQAVAPLITHLMRCQEVSRVVVFQKTIAFMLAKTARSLGARLLADYDDGSRQRIDGSWYPESLEQENERWIRLMDGLVVSCEELRKWVQPWAARIYTIPTCLDVDNYDLPSRKDGDNCVIGWVGSHLSHVFLRPIESALLRVTQNHNCQVYVVGADDPGLNPEIGVRFLSWRLELEPQVFGQIDIGIMPLPDNERARMKAGFKLLQYMAAGLPVIASPIGLNREIVRHGWNGFLANSVEEWETYLMQLAGDPHLRSWMGQNGRKFVQENYRLEVAAKLWRNTCEDIIRK